MITIAEFNRSLNLPEQDPREVVYNSAYSRGNELFPFKFPRNYPAFHWNNPSERLEELQNDLRSYPLELYLQLYETAPNLQDHHITKATINTKRITIATTSQEPNRFGFSVIVKRHIFFHMESPFYSIDSITETGKIFMPKSKRQNHISVNTGSIEEQPWVANKIAWSEKNKNDTATIAATVSTSSSESQSVQTIEMAHEGNYNEHITSTRFLNLQSGNYESLDGKRTLIQTFTTTCNHCKTALEDFENMSEFLLDKGTVCVALCIRGNIDEAREFAPENSNLQYLYADANAADMIRQAAKSTDNILTVPFYIATNDDGEIIQINKSRNSVLTAINNHPTASKCFVSPVPQRTLQKMAESSLEPEPLLVPSNNRFVMYPIIHEDIWKMYKNHFACFWTPEEIDLKGDKIDFDNLSQQERHFIKYVLAFFAASDGIVNENLAKNFSNEIQASEARAFYGFQMAMENVHAETYSLLIDTYITDMGEKDKLFHALDNFECIKKKANWALQWCNSEYASFSERCVAFSAVEGIFFSGSFCAIYWIRQKGIMPGLCTSNDLIARDEGLHTDFACLIYNKLVNKLPQSRIAQIIRSAVEIEKEFITSALPVELLGMNSTTMTQYIEFVADRLLLSLGNPKQYNTSNPYEWMNQISLGGKSNFFEKQVTEYALSSVGWEDRTFDMDADF